MRITLDRQAYAIYLAFHLLEPERAEARQLTDEIVANYGPDGQLAGLEILDASHVLGADADRVVFEVMTPTTG